MEKQRKPRLPVQKRSIETRSKIIDAGMALFGASDEIVHRVKMFSPRIDENRLINELEDMICRYLLKNTP